MAELRYANRKYGAVNRVLAQLPPELLSVAFSFAEIETLIGARLPESAWRATFWSSSSNGVARGNWGSLGWKGRVSRLNGGSVTFTRVPLQEW